MQRIQTSATYPVQFSVDYPDRPLGRVSTGFRLFAAIPILIVLGAVSGGSWQLSSNASATVIGALPFGLLTLAPALVIVFRQKYPRWWYDWNLEMLRFTDQVAVYLALMDDRYPSTDDQQSVHLDFPYPDVPRDLDRLRPLVKWLAAFPHCILLFFLTIGAVLGVIGAWFAIVFTGRYPRGIFAFVEGVIRWHNRVVAYAILLVTDEYPPFRLAP